MTTAVAVDRLRASRDIAAVLRSDRSRAGRLVVCNGRQRTVGDAGGARIATVASRKVGSAVSRNRAKRLLREAARQLPWRDDVDVVLVARPSLASSTSQVVSAELGRLARDLDLLAP